MKQAPPFALALVTGATSGIGLSLAELLAEKGIALLIHGRNEQQLEAVAAGLSGKVAVSIVLADLSTAEGQQHMTSIIQEHAPDLLINNAAMGWYGPVLSYSTAEQMKILTVDAEAVVRFSIEGARALQAKGRGGVIVNVSSAVAFNIAPRMALYSASKALLNQFSESFDEEVRPLGIRVLAACPGGVASNFRYSAGGVPSSKWEDLFIMTAPQAANQIWGQIVRRKKVHIFNWPYRCTACLSRFILPKALVAKIFERIVLHIQGF